MKKLIVLTLALLMVAGCSAPSLKLGLGMVAGMTGSNASVDADGSTQADVTACAVTLDSNGKIVGVSWDVMQCKATVTTEGAVTVADSVQSKKELKENYNMKGASAIGKEWYEQIAALEEYSVGKTPADVTGMAVKESNGHTNVPDVAELTSSCTMSCGDFFATLEKAAANAK
jgi:hypothetical protein